jgi:predicted DNA-binding transcriptional regulator AlpA
METAESIKNARATYKILPKERAAELLGGRLLTQDQVAEMLGVDPKTLQAWRTTQRYPLKFVKIGRCVRYRPEDVETFIESRTFAGN